MGTELTDNDKRIIEKLVKTEHYQIEINRKRFVICERIGYLMNYSRKPPSNADHVEEGKQAQAYHAGRVLANMHKRGIVRKSPRGEGRGWRSKVVAYFPKDKFIQEVRDEMKRNGRDVRNFG